MASVRVMYWKEIPVQVQVKTEEHTASVQLDERFQHAVDAIAMFDGDTGGDKYLEGWAYGEWFEIEGEPMDIAKELSNKYNERMPLDIVTRIRDLTHNGKRCPVPGSIDHWIDTGQ